jgi:iron complex transport system substrate-binding protein
MSSTLHRLYGNKSMLFAVLLVFIMLNITGCSSNNADTPVKSEKATITITDCVGRKVQVPLNPKRIACLCPEAGQALALYGQGDKIVATSGGMQRDVMMLEMYPSIKGLPVPKKSGVINIEELISTKAELVFVKGDTTNNEAEMQKLHKANIPVVALEFYTLEEQINAMKMVAEIVGCEEEGQKYEDFCREMLGMVQAKTAQLSEQNKATIYHSVSEATRTDTTNCLAADWTKAAGLINVSVGEELEFTDGDHYATLEQILLWNPDYILVNDPNVVDYIMKNEQWQSLQAVKNKRVIPLPIGISRWGHPSSLETPLAVAWAAKTIYPELFREFDLIQTTKDFYLEFFDWELDDADVNRILSSQGMRIAKNK